MNWIVNGRFVTDSFRNCYGISKRSIFVSAVVVNQLVIIDMHRAKELPQNTQNQDETFSFFLIHH